MEEYKYCKRGHVQLGTNVGIHKVTSPRHKRTYYQYCAACKRLRERLANPKRIKKHIEIFRIDEDG